MIVDGDVIIVRLLRATLKQAQYRMTFGYEGEIALPILRR